MSKQFGARFSLEECYELATEPSPWNVGNKVLYDLCKNMPLHTDTQAVLAKIWLIGRAYAAAIERRKNKADSNDGFYETIVGPRMMKSNMDTWLAKTSRYKKANAASLPLMLETHQNVVKLFETISGLKKRSLASKYLHFHQPAIFYIYDSRAVSSMRRISHLIEPFDMNDERGDREYSRFASKCLAIQEKFWIEFKVHVSPRELDNMLLALARN